MLSDNFGDVIVGPISPPDFEYQEAFDVFCHCGIDEYACRCSAGYANGLCEYEYASLYESDCTVMSGGACDIDVDECASEPCQREGSTCADALDSYTCTCAEGFSGDNCEDHLDECASEPCANGGVCYDFVDSYQCACASPWHFAGR